jgi:outer membrane protein OmpA-like peptidoglycan-associated protein
MSIEPVTFLRGSDEPGIQSRRDLEALAVRIQSMPRYYLEVVGHARAQGDIEEVRALAGSRAKKVVEFLAALGVSGNRMRAIAEEPSQDAGEAQSVTFLLKQKPY